MWHSVLYAFFILFVHIVKLEMHKHQILVIIKESRLKYTNLNLVIFVKQVLQDTSQGFVLLKY